MSRVLLRTGPQDGPRTLLTGGERSPQRPNRPGRFNPLVNSSAPAARLLIVRSKPRDRTHTCRVIHDVHGLDELAGPWDELADPCSLPGVLHAWVSACAHSFHPQDRLRVVTVVRDGRLVAAAALAVNAAGELEPVGMAQLYEPTDFLFADDDALAALAHALARLREPLVVRRITAGSPTIAALTRAYGGRGFVLTKPSSSSPRTTLNERWTAPEGDLSARRRSDLRRARRRAESMGELTYDLLCPSPDELEPLLDEAFAIEAASWRGGTGSALEADRPRADFVRRFAHARAAAGSLRVGLLRIDGAGVAMQIGVEHDERLWLLKIGYDDRFARCSPGSLLLLESLRDAAGRGLRGCELLGTAEGWTAAWASDGHEIIALRAYPLHARGLLELGGRVGRSVGRRIVAATADDAR
jgi:CelD/BcsL family acetyltransferase involved in cellulose biosynthesis